MALFIGIDGGGTKTTTVLVDDKNNSLAESKSGGSNWNSVGDQEAHKNLKEGILAVLSSANKKQEEVQGICLGMAGVDRPQDKEKLDKWVRQILPNKDLKVRIENDGVIALVSGTKKLHGIVVISGTGSIVIAANNGVVTRAGGWGPLLGDEGSGFLIGLTLLKTVCCASDRGEHSLLKKMTLEELQLQSTEELIPWTYTQDKLNSSRFAALAPIVYKAASQKDQSACSILESQASMLLSTINTAHKMAHFSSNDFSIVLSGGNLTHDDGNGIYSQMLRKKISEEFPEANVVLPQILPQLAASTLAIDLIKH